MKALLIKAGNQNRISTGQMQAQSILIIDSKITIMRRAIVNLPLHGGKCPKYLFPRMRAMSGAISELILDEYGVDEYLRRLSNPYFFQALGCAVAYDWHSSGLTTTLTAALKESVNKLNMGITFAGGKGKTSRKTLTEIDDTDYPLSTKKVHDLKYKSRMSAKVDSSLIQDNYNLYHHCFVLTEKGKWAVIQQGMNDSFARRYHWLSDNVDKIIDEPHNGISSVKKHDDVLDMTSKKSKDTQNVSLDLVRDNPSHLSRYFNLKSQATLGQFTGDCDELTISFRHKMINMNKRNIDTLKKAYEFQPKDYEELLSLRGIGAKTIRSLALISELAYGAESSWKDPAKYSFAHGGKDSIPYPVDRKLMDDNTSFLRDALYQAKLGEKDKIGALKRLGSYINA